MNDDTLASLSIAVAGGGWGEDPPPKFTASEIVSMVVLGLVVLGGLISLVLVVLGVVK